MPPQAPLGLALQSCPAPGPHTYTKRGPAPASIGAPARQSIRGLRRTSEGPAHKARAATVIPRESTEDCASSRRRNPDDALPGRVPGTRAAGAGPGGGPAPRPRQQLVPPGPVPRRPGRLSGGRGPGLPLSGGPQPPGHGLHEAGPQGLGRDRLSGRHPPGFQPRSRLAQPGRGLRRGGTLPGSGRPAGRGGAHRSGLGSLVPSPGRSAPGAGGVRPGRGGPGAGRGGRPGRRRGPGGAGPPPPAARAPGGVRGAAEARRQARSRQQGGPPGARGALHLRGALRRGRGDAAPGPRDRPGLARGVPRPGESLLRPGTPGAGPDAARPLLRAEGARRPGPPPGGSR